DHEAARRRPEGNAFGRNALLCQGVNFAVYHSQQVQTLASALLEQLRIRGFGAGRRCAGAARGQQEVLLRAVQIRAVQVEERLPRLHALARLTHEQLRDPALDLERHIRQLRLVVGDAADSTKRTLEWSFDDLTDPDPDQLSTRFVDQDHALLLLRLRDRNQVHAADRALTGPLLVDRGMHRAGIVIDSVRG